MPTDLDPATTDLAADEAVYQKWQASGGSDILNMTTCYPGGRVTFYDIPTPDPGATGWIAQASFGFPTITPHTWPGPSTSRPYNQTLVNYATYLWIDPADWQPLGATVTSPDGAVTVTATASPVSATWDMGDGHGYTPDGTITCYGDDAHIAYHPGIGDSPCRYTYTHSSANRAQIGDDPNNRPNHVTVTITWDVTWTCESGCAATGTIDPITTTATLDLVVGEVQSVITG